MQFDTTLLFHHLNDMAAYTQAAEAMGFDGIWTAETRGDPFLPLTLAAEHSRRLTLGTAIAVAFPNDEIVETIAVTGTWAELPGKIQQRYGSLIDRASYYLPFTPGANDEGWQATIAGFRP